MAKAIKSDKPEVFKINGTFEDIIKASVSGNPKPKAKNKKPKKK